jgi:hypothetical protein
MLVILVGTPKEGFDVYEPFGSESTSISPS